MTTFMNQFPAQMSQILAIRDKFVEVSKQSDEKLTAMIEAAKDFRSGMEPLKKEVDQLQTRVKNLQFCIEGLSHVQNFYKTGREVEQTIIQGPATNLSEYLKAMDRIKDSLVYFNQNDTDHLEYTRLSTLLSNGLKALHKYFEEILRQSFVPMPSDVLYRLAEKDDAISLNGTRMEHQEGSASAIPASLDCESISEDSVHTLQEISTWLRKATTLVDSKEGERKSHPHLARLFHSRGAMDAMGSPEACQISQSLALYCDFRKDLMRVSLVKLREYQKSLEKNAQNARSRVGGSQMNIATLGRRRGLKAIGIVWDANSRRGVANDIRDTDDLDSEHYATSLSAFFILIERERLLLDRLNLAANSHEANFAYSLICRSALTDLMNEGGAYVRLMSRVISRNEFYMIVSLLTIMRRFIDLSSTVVETLKIVSSLAQPLIDMVNRFRGQIKATIDAFLQQLQPGSGSSQVPPDATVHELASNVLLFLEKLLDYEITVGTALTWEEVKITPENIFQYLTTVDSKPKMARSAFGQYIFRVITSLVANIDKKAEAYSDDLSRIVFQMNNLRYTLTNLKSTGLQNILDEYDNTAVHKFAKILNESKQVYTKALSDTIGLTTSNKDAGGGNNVLRRHIPKRRLSILSDSTLPDDEVVGVSSQNSSLNLSASSSCMRCINLPTPAFLNQFSQRRQMDSKERSQMKDIWNNVNQGIAGLMKQHSQLSIPDKELREELRVCLSKELVPLYQTFHDRSLQVPFTSRREKYIKMTPTEFQDRLNQMFGPTQTLPPIVPHPRLPFRLLVRRHGVDLTYSPMIMSGAFLHSEQARASDFTTCPSDRPMITQIACQSGPEFARCAAELANLCDGIDLNCGCPQRWAMEEGYGAAMLKKPELIEDLIKSARSAVPRWRIVRTPENAELRVPFSVSTKIRLVPCPPRAIGGDSVSATSSTGMNNVEMTTELVRRAAQMGVDWVTIHGRTPTQRSVVPARWHDIKEVIAARVGHCTDTSAPLPIFLNGDIKSFNDAVEAYRISGCQGVMAAQGLLQDPALFQRDGHKDPWSLYQEWLHLCQEYPESMPFKTVHRQAYWIMEKHLGKKERSILHQIGDVNRLEKFEANSNTNSRLA
ncbi:hypothetical protein Aperf_G00000004087 [Anoplocephala perfoliata]